MAESGCGRSCCWSRAGCSGSLSPEAIRLAAVVELIHSATLVHDDVIDDADTRRGKPSANTIWGNQTSVLAGDWLYMQAFQIALRQRNFEILDLLISLTQQMVDGELLQLERIGRIDITEADSMELIDRKTASLFCGLHAAGRHRGRGVGSASRRAAGRVWLESRDGVPVVDDMLDFTSRETVLGKPVGNDLREGKVTLPLIYALQEANEAERAKVAQVLKDRHYETVPFDEIRALLNEIRRHRAGSRSGP